MLHSLDKVPQSVGTATDIKSRTGRPPRRSSETDVRAVEYFLSRLARYGRQAGYDGRRLEGFSIALAIWREFTQAGVRSPVLAKLSAYRRARLAQNFAEAEGELEETLGRAARIAELASYVASWYPSRDPLRAAAMRQIERLQEEANAREYWSGVPAKFIPYTGLRPARGTAEGFWRWYNGTFHSGDAPDPPA
jgi:hypothetical protein